jgi:hypothetical protein
LTQLIAEHWSDASERVIKEWTQYDNPAQQWYHAVFIRRSDGVKIKLQLGINGGFLVQGFPVDKLPESIYKNADFQAFFSDTNFDVALSCSGIVTYVTRKNSLSCNFAAYFTFFESSVGLIIKGKRVELVNGNVEELLYLGSNFFHSILPTNLINCSSHWLNISTNTVELRKTNYHDYINNKETYYKLDLNECLLLDVIMEQYLIDIQSTTFNEIYNKIIQRIELHGYVRVFNKNKQILIELPRMNLIFEIDQLCHFKRLSRYDGFILTANRHFTWTRKRSFIM